MASALGFPLTGPVWSLGWARVLPVGPQLQPRRPREVACRSAGPAYGPPPRARRWAHSTAGRNTAPQRAERWLTPPAAAAAPPYALRTATPVAYRQPVAPAGAGRHRPSPRRSRERLTCGPLAAARRVRIPDPRRMRDAREGVTGQPWRPRRVRSAARRAVHSFIAPSLPILVDQAVMHTPRGRQPPPLLRGEGLVYPTLSHHERFRRTMTGRCLASWGEAEGQRQDTTKEGQDGATPSSPRALPKKKRAAPARGARGWGWGRGPPAGRLGHPRRRRCADSVCPFPEEDSEPRPGYS